MPTNKSTKTRTTHQTRHEAPGLSEKTKPVSELFEQAMSSYEQAFRTGVRLQEECGRTWTTLLEQTGPTREWQKTIRTMADEILPEVQKRMEEGLRMVEQNSRASLELLKLFKKNVEVPQTNPFAEGQGKLLSFWEGYLNSMKGSAQAVAQANTQAMESWKELFRKSTQMAAATAAA